MPGLTDLLKNPRRLRQFAETPGNYPAALEYATQDQAQGRVGRRPASRASSSTKEPGKLDTGEYIDQVELPDGSVVRPATESGKLVKAPGKSNLYLDPATGEPYHADPSQATGLRSAWNTARQVKRDGKVYATISGVGEREIGADPKAAEDAAKAEAKRAAENRRLELAREKRPYNIDRVTGEPVPLQTDEQWAAIKQAKAAKLDEAARVKRLKDQADLLELDAEDIRETAPKPAKEDEEAFSAAEAALSPFADGQNMDEVAAKYAAAPATDEASQQAKAAAENYLAYKDKVKPAKEAEAKVKELKLRANDIKRQILDPEGWKKGKTASIAALPDDDLVAEVKAQADIITEQEGQAVGTLDQITQGRNKIVKDLNDFTAARQRQASVGLSVEEQQAADHTQAQMEQSLAEYDDWHSEAKAEADASLKAAADRRDVLKVASTEIEARTAKQKESAAASKAKMEVMVKAKPLYKDWAGGASGLYVEDWRTEEETPRFKQEAAKAGLSMPEAKEALQTYRQLDWSNGRRDPKTANEIHEDARLLPNGEITVNPMHLLDPEAYDAAADATQTTPEAKARAKAMRAELAVPVAEEAYKNLRKNSDFAAWLDANTTGTPLQRMEKFNAEMKSGGALNASLMKFLGSAASLPSGWLGTIAGLTGSDKALEYARYWQDRSQAYGTAAGEAGKGTNMAGRFMASVAGGVPSVMESMAVGGVAGRLIGSGVAALGVAAVDAAAQSGGGTFVDAVDAYIAQGLSPEEAKAKAVAPALASGLATGVLTAIGGGGVESLLRREGQELAKAAIKRGLKTMVAREVIEGVGEEALEEFSDQLLQGIIAQASYNPNKSLDQIMSEAIEAGLVGGVLGGGASGIRAYAEGKDANQTGAVPPTPGSPAPMPVQPRPAGPAPTPTPQVPQTPQDVADQVAKFNPTGATPLPQSVAATAKRTGRTPEAVARQAASGVVKLAQGQSIESLDIEEQEALGFVNKNGKIVAADNKVTPLVYDYKGKPIIRNAAAEWLTDEAQEELAGMVKLTEAERKAQIDAEEAAAKAKPTTAPAKKARPADIEDWDWTEKGKVRRRATEEWFEEGMANADVNAAFERAHAAGADALASHGMAKFGTLSGAYDALMGLLTKGVDPKRGRGALDVAPLTVAKGSAESQGGQTAGGTSYRDGPFILLSRKQSSISNSADIHAILVNDANAGQLEAIRREVHKLRPDIIVDLYSKADVVTRQLNQPANKKAGQAAPAKTESTPQGSEAVITGGSLPSNTGSSPVPASTPAAATTTTPTNEPKPQTAVSQKPSSGPIVLESWPLPVVPAQSPAPAQEAPTGPAPVAGGPKPKHSIGKGAVIFSDVYRSDGGGEITLDGDPVWDAEQKEWMYPGTTKGGRSIRVAERFVTKVISTPAAAPAPTPAPAQTASQPAAKNPAPADFNEYESQQIEVANREAALKALSENSKTTAIITTGDGVVLQLGDRQSHPTKSTSLIATVTNDQLTPEERKEARRLNQESDLAETSEERAELREKQQALVRRVFERVYRTPAATPTGPSPAQATPAKPEAPAAPAEPALTPAQADQMARAQAAHEKSKATIQKMENDPEIRAKKLYAENMRFAAIKRQITGKLTGKEAAAKAKREASNYEGKPVSVDGKNATVVGTAFGKVKVKFEDGTTSSVAADKINAPVNTAAKEPSQPAPASQEAKPAATFKAGDFVRANGKGPVFKVESIGEDGWVYLANGQGSYSAEDAAKILVQSTEDAAKKEAVKGGWPWADKGEAQPPPAPSTPQRRMETALNEYEFSVRQTLVGTPTKATKDLAARKLDLAKRLRARLKAMTGAVEYDVYAKELREKSGELEVKPVGEKDSILFVNPEKLIDRLAGKHKTTEAAREALDAFILHEFIHKAAIANMDSAKIIGLYNLLTPAAKAASKALYLSDSGLTDFWHKSAAANEFAAAHEWFAQLIEARLRGKISNQAEIEASKDPAFRDKLMALLKDFVAQLRDIAKLVTDKTQAARIEAEADAVQAIVADMAAKAGLELGQQAKPPSQAAVAPEVAPEAALPQRDAVDEELAKAFDGLSAPPATQPVEQVALPKERREAMLKAAGNIVDLGLTEPTDLAARLDKLAPNGSLRKYARSFWRLMTGFNADLQESPDWQAVFDSINVATQSVEDAVADATVTPPQAAAIAKEEAMPEPAKQAAPFDPVAAKGQKKYLLTEVAAAVKAAPRRSEMPEDVRDALNEIDEITAKFANQERRPLTADESAELSSQVKKLSAKVREAVGTITIEVPGDGTFIILNEKGALALFQKRADKFPTTQSKDDMPAKPTAQTPTAVPSIKKPKTTADMVAAIYPMVSTDTTRDTLTTVKGDGTNLWATNGRILVRVEQENGGGKGADNVSYDEKGNAQPWPVEKGNYNGEAIIPDDRKVPVHTIDTGRWFSIMSQARAVIKVLPSDKSQSSYTNAVSIYQNPDGSLGAFTSDAERGDYVHNIQPNAKFLASYDPEYVQTILRVARNLGNEQIELRIADDISPATLRTSNATFVIMPMRVNGAAAYSPKAQAARPTPPVTTQPTPAPKPEPAPEPAPTKVAQTPAAASPAKEGIDDFGEKLGGARKDKVATVNQTLTDDEIAGKTLSEIWPKSEIASIEDDELAAYATTLRSIIPSKPQKGYKLNAWVGKVKMVKQLMRFAEDKGVPEMLAMMRGPEYNLGVLADRVAFLQGLPREHWDRVGEVRNYPNAYRFGEGADSSKKIPAPYADANVDGYRVRADNLDDLMEAVKAKLAKGKPVAKMEFEVRGKTGAWGINKKGDPHYRKLKTFADSKEALAYRDSNYDNLVKAWEDVKERDNVKETDLRTDTNRPRSAEDWRKGKDATSQMFNDAFGFRGVEFGNWVSQGKNAAERQGMMNDAYDALHDLASILNIPTKALSLNGQIGLGFGSRGQGWASAHYEPGSLVINLTKTRGAGTLAHELFHAFDHYFGRARGVSIKDRAGVYITNEPATRYVNQKTGQALSVKRWNEIKKGFSSSINEADWKLQEGVRPEVEDAFEAVVKALDASPMAQRARMNDKGQRDYWGSTIERAARAFENYVIHKMQQKGYQNDYLANVVRIEDFVRNPNRYPYLLDNEIEPVAKAFDDLFSTIKSRETNKGVELYAPPSQASVGQAVNEAFVKKVQDSVEAGRPVGTSNPTTASKTGEGTDSGHNVELDRLRKNNPLAYRQNALILTRYPVVAKKYRALHAALAKADAPVIAAKEEVKKAKAALAAAQKGIKDRVASLRGMKTAQVRASLVNEFIAANLTARAVKAKDVAHANLAKANAKAAKAADYQSKAISEILDSNAIPEDVAFQIYEDYITAVQSNLLALIELFPKRLRDVARLWYDGANIIAQKFGKQYNATIEQASAVLAVFSPQKDWFMNVSLAQRMMNIWENDQETVWSPEMTKQFIMRSGEPQPVESVKKGDTEPTISTRESLITDANPEGIVYQHGAIKKVDDDGNTYWENWDNQKAAENLKDAQRMLKDLEGKTLSQIKDRKLKARFIRILSEVRDSSAYPIVTPDGRMPGTMQVNNDKVTLSKVAWGGYNTIEKAISIMERSVTIKGRIITDEHEVISIALGDQHKVRSFYNNIVDPANKSGHVTMDTHAIAAIHWMPHSGSSLEVTQNFGGGGVKNDGIAGIKGTYAANAEAYRRAAVVFDMLPREVQSITWEAVRLLFPKEFKTKGNIDKVRAIWNRYFHGDIDIETARAEIFAIATTSKDFPQGKDIAGSIKDGKGLGDTAWAAAMGVGIDHPGGRGGSDDSGTLPKRGGPRRPDSGGGGGQSRSDGGRRNSAAMVRPTALFRRGRVGKPSLSLPPGQASPETAAWKTVDGRTWLTEAEAKGTGLMYYNIEPDEAGLNDQVTEEERRMLQRGKVLDIEAETLRNPPSSSAAVPPFYSKLERVLTEKMANRTDAATIKGIITNPQTGIKAEELKWSGIMPWLDGQGGKIDKQAVLDYLAADGAVRLEEVTHGYSPNPNEAKARELNDLRSEYNASLGAERPEYLSASEWADELSAQEKEIKAREKELVLVGGYKPAPEGKFAKYQLPGGENYREVVLAMPEKVTSDSGLGKPTRIKIEDSETYFEDTGAYVLKYPVGGEILVKDDGRFYVITGNTEYYGDNLQAAENLLVSYLNDDGLNVKGSGYTSSHFQDVPNYVAHMRVNDRVDGEGRPGTFLEEIQSDRHQAGREKGYQRTLTTAEQTRKSALEGITNTRDFTEAEQAEYDALRDGSGGEAIPDAPFRKDWPLQMFKRALADAVASGKQWIGWTTGETQAERYDLSKQIDELQFRTQDGGETYILAAVKDDDYLNVFPSGDPIPKAKLTAYVGKSVAEQIIDRGTTGSISGNGLKVGGEGMKGFYDSILPKEIGKYVKQWGGMVVKGKIQDLANLKKYVSSYSAWLEYVDPDGLTSKDEFYAMSESERLSAVPDDGKTQSTPVWRVDITPAMQAGVSQGQSLFLPPSSRGSVPTQITRDMRQQLYDRGYTKKQVNKMTPAEAHAILNPPAEAEQEPDTEEASQTDADMEAFIAEQQAIAEEEAAAREALRNDPDAIDAVQASGKMSGRNLSKQFEYPEARAVYQALAAARDQLGGPETVQLDKLREWAKKTFESDPEKYVQWAADMAEDNKLLDVDEQAVLGQAFQFLTREARLTGDKNIRTLLNKVGNYYLDTGTRLAQAMSARRDPLETPHERWTKALDIVFGPSESVRRQLRVLPTESGKARRIARLEEELAEARGSRRADVEAALKTARAQQTKEELLEKDDAESEKIKKAVLSKLDVTEDDLMLAGTDRVAMHSAILDLPAVKAGLEAYKGKDNDGYNIMRLAFRGFSDAHIANALNLNQDDVGQFIHDATNAIIRPAVAEQVKAGTGFGGLIKAGFARLKKAVGLGLPPRLAGQAALDKEYMQAVETGDMEKAQRMVDAAARDAGYDVKAYRGQEKGATVLTLNNEGGEFEKGVVWATTLPRMAKAYNRNVDSVWVKTGNARIEQARGASKGRYGFIDPIIEAQKEKYDSVVFKNTRDLPDDIEDRLDDAKLKERFTGDVIAVFSPSQIKSADPVTRDESDQVIPLSQRFNPASDSILRLPPKAIEDQPSLAKGTRQTVADVTAEVNRVMAYALQSAKARNSGKLMSKVVMTPGGQRVRVFVPFDPDDMANYYAFAREYTAAKSSAFDKVYEYWINWPLLSGPQTQVANITGNAAQVAWHYTGQRLAEATLNLAYRDPTAPQFREFKHVLKGFWQGIGPAYDMARQTFLTEGDTIRHKYLGEPMEIDVVNGDLDKVGNIRASVGGKLGRINRLPGRVLRFTDAFFKTAIMYAEASAVAYRRAHVAAKAQGLKGQARAAFIDTEIANTINDTSSAVWGEVMKTAEELLFQDENMATEMVDTVLGGYKGIRDLEQKLAEAEAKGDYQQSAKLQKRIRSRKIVGSIMRWIFPFQRTPTNIVRVGIKKAGGSAISLLYGLTMAGWQSMGKNGVPMIKSYPKAMQIKDASETLLAGLGWLALASMLEGDDDDDKKKVLLVGTRSHSLKDRGATDQFLRKYGGENSIVWQDGNGKVLGTLPFGRYEPAATLLTTWIDAYRNYQEVKRLKSQGENALYTTYMMSSLVSSLEDKSFLQGFANAMQFVRDVEEKRESPDENAGSKMLMNNIIPNLIKQPLRNMDDVLRERTTAGPGYAALPNPAVAPKLPIFAAQPKISTTGERLTKAFTPPARLLFQANTKVTPQADALLYRANRLNPTKRWSPQPLNRDDYTADPPGKAKPLPITDPAKRRQFAELAGRLYATKAAQVAAKAMPSEKSKPTPSIITAFKKAREDAMAAARAQAHAMGLHKPTSTP